MGTFMLQEYFGLKDNPFSIHPNPHYYCDLKFHEEALQMVLYSVKNYDTLIKITGQIGLGKSMVAACVRDKLKITHHVCEIRNPNMKIESLITSLINQLPRKEVLGSEKDLLPVDILESRLKYFNEHVQPVVLIIDEAQAMEDSLLETLRLLTNLEQRGRPLLQIILFGQKELDVKLAQDKFKQLRQRICFSYEIRSLRLREVIFYINFRLSVAGIEGRSIFHQDAMEMIAKYTKGVPRNINIIAHKAMLFASSAQSLDVKKSHVWQALRDHGLVSMYDVFSRWKIYLIILLVALNLVVALNIFLLYTNGVL